MACARRWRPWPTSAPCAPSRENRAAYPDSDLGRALAAVARTIRGDVGVSLVTVDQGEWDMHADLGTSTGAR